VCAARTHALTRRAKPSAAARRVIASRLTRHRRRLACPPQGALGAAASEASKQLSHSLSFAINLAVLSNLAQHTHHRSGGRVGPTALVALSAILVCADPLRHVLQDTGMWSSAASHMYLPADANSTCEPGAGGDALCRAPRAAGGYGHHAPWVCDADRQRCVCPEASIRCLSAVGWIFTIVCTYLGFACLFAGACTRARCALLKRTR
jgi:hypothetical protein